MNKNLGILRGLLAALTALVFWLPSAQAAYIVDVKIGQALLSNSGDANELAALMLAAGVPNLILDFKVKVTESSNPATPNPGTLDQWFIDVSPATPGYFGLKIGIGSTTATANTFFFQNIGELSKLVWSNDQVQFLTGGNCRNGNDNACNIGRLSHYVGSNGVTSTVPEPATAALLGLGLLGFAVARRKLAKKPTA